MDTQPAVQDKLLSVIIPIYNDAACVKPFLSALTPVLDTIKAKYSFECEYIFVMDPSRDETEKAIVAEQKRHPSIKLLVLSRRFGQQPAILAGLFHCRGEAAVVMDVDLQDPAELILEMMEKYVREQFNVVYAVRKKRPQDESWLRRVFVATGYYLMNKISDIPIPRDVGDFRLIDRRVIEELRKLKERHGFFRGLVPLVGFRQTGVGFDRQSRSSGKTNYHPFFGSITNGMNAMVCFSNKLLALSGILSALFFLGFIAVSVLLIYAKLYTSLEFDTGIVLVTIFLFLIASVQCLSFAILGSYIGRIYDEVKERPLYIVDKRIGF